MPEQQVDKILAIDGGQPTFPKPLHVGRPNIGSREKFYGYTNKMFDDGWLTNDGPYVRELEKRVADHHNVAYCVAMCNATLALEIAIRALGLHGEVIVPSYTFVATAHALHWQEIKPVFADINPGTHSIDPLAVEKMITPLTTGIIGVHLWGKVADVDGLSEVADKHKLKLMFDAAHAFGCSHEGKMIGNFGECEVLSLHATKLLNSFEGGVILTNNSELAEKAKLMRNFGFSGVDNVIYPGTNGKMTEVAAAMGLVNLDEIENIIEHNYNNYKHYQTLLKDLSNLKLLEYSDSKNTYQYIVIEVLTDGDNDRDYIVEALHAEGILARRYFWPGCHRMKPYVDYFPHAGLMLKHTEEVSNKVIVLPTGLSVQPEDISKIVEVLALIMEKVRA